jgi:hypothetical protein
MRPMTTILIVGFISLLPLETQADQIQLTLNCQVENAIDMKTTQESKSSESFSAIVHLPNSQNDVAIIEATTFGCFDYVGSFSELEVSGDCERTVGTMKFREMLTINRVTGSFEHNFFLGNDAMEYSGHCTPGKRLF